MELPYRFATSNAPEFSRAQLSYWTLSVQRFCFGSEDGEVEPFERSLRLIQQAGD